MRFKVGDKVSRKFKDVVLHGVILEASQKNFTAVNMTDIEYRGEMEWYTVQWPDGIGYGTCELVELAQEPNNILKELL